MRSCFPACRSVNTCVYTVSTLSSWSDFMILIGLLLASYTANERSIKGELKTKPSGRVDFKLCAQNHINKPCFAVKLLK